MCTFDVQHILQNAYFHEYFSFNHNLYVFIIYILCCIYIYIVNGFCPLRLVVFAFGNDRVLLVVPVQ